MPDKHATSSTSRQTYLDLFNSVARVEFYLTAHPEDGATARAALADILEHHRDLMEVE